jgi:hypothetical protein
LKDKTKTKTKTFNHKVEKPIFMSLRGPKALDDKGHEGTRREMGKPGTSPLINTDDTDHEEIAGKVGTSPQLPK